jgi:trehalose 6-phosphate phosphatase
MMQSTDSPTVEADARRAVSICDLPLGETAFFFDVDGTLLELLAEPAAVVADPDLHDLVRRFVARTEGALALVSGRALADLDRIFAPLALPAAALHGGEIRFPDGSHRAAPATLMDAARLPVGHFVAEHPGLMLEDKGATLAVHFRRRPDLAAAVLAFLSGLGPGEEVAVQEGKLVAELKPVQFNKGSAIAALMNRPPFKGRRPVFYGDDLTDESGFAYVNSVGGLTARVGAAEVSTEARAHFADPPELRRHLRALLAAPAESCEARAT